MKKKETAERLAELMQIYGIKQVDIVKRTGIPKSAVSMYCSGVRKPPQDKLTQIADAFGVSETWLMGYDVPMLENEEGRKQTAAEHLGNMIGAMFRDNSAELAELMLSYEALDKSARKRLLAYAKCLLERPDPKDNDQEQT